MAEKEKEAISVQPEEVGERFMTQESEIEIEKKAKNAEEILAENADAQVDEAKPSKQLIIELDTDSFIMACYFYFNHI